MTIPVDILQRSDVGRVHEVHGAASRLCRHGSAHGKVKAVSVIEDGHGILGFKRRSPHVRKVQRGESSAGLAGPVKSASF